MIRDFKKVVIAHGNQSKILRGDNWSWENFRNGAFEGYKIANEELHVEETVDTLKELINWVDNLEADAWWVDTPQKGGFDFDKIKQLIHKIEQ
jgi:hypothetical protein